MKIQILGSTLALLLISTGVFATNQQNIDEIRAVSANEKITLDVQRGNVEIKAASDNQFRVSGKLDEKAEGFTLDSANGFTKFSVKMPKQLFESEQSKSNGSALVIIVPIGSNIEFSGVNVNVTASGIQGSSLINTVNGDINALRLTNSVTLSTVNGKIDSEALQGQITLKTVNGEIDDKTSEGRMSVESINGSIELDSNPTELMVTVVNGEVDLVLNGTQQVALSSVNGDIELDLHNQIAPTIKGSSVSGKFELALPAQLDAKVTLKTSAGGSIKNTLTSDKPNRAKYGPASSLIYSAGNGSGNIEINTVSGGIEMKKH